MLTYPRLTLSESITLSGPGLHTGDPSTVIIQPGSSGFRLNGTPLTPDSVTDTSRSTRIGNISTIEHALSALAGLGITDADIEVSGGELPAADGCSMPYVVAILQAGITPCGTLEIEGPFARIFFQESSPVGPIKMAIGLGEGWWRYIFERPGTFVGQQEFEFAWSGEKYSKEVAPARTTVFESELESIQSAGLGRGLDESSCLVIGEEGYRNQARFHNEPARHKLLDLIGDLALTGIPIAHLDIVAERSGHTANIEAARRLARSVTIRRKE